MTHTNGGYAKTHFPARTSHPYSAFIEKQSHNDDQVPIKTLIFYPRKVLDNAMEKYKKQNKQNPPKPKKKTHKKPRLESQLIGLECLLLFREPQDGELHLSLTPAGTLCWPLGALHSETHAKNAHFVIKDRNIDKSIQHNERHVAPATANQALH